MHADTVIPPEYLDKLRIIVLPSAFYKNPCHIRDQPGSNSDMYLRRLHLCPQPFLQPGKRNVAVAGQPVLQFQCSRNSLTRCNRSFLISSRSISNSCPQFL